MNAQVSWLDYRKVRLQVFSCMHCMMNVINRTVICRRYCSNGRQEGATDNLGDKVEQPTGTTNSKVKVKQKLCAVIKVTNQGK